MAGKEIRINERRFEVHDWAETFAPQTQPHACGKPIAGTFKVTLPQSVGIGALVEMVGNQGRAIVDDEEPAADGQFLVKGSILAVRPGVPLAEPSVPPPPADTAEVPTGDGA